MKKFLSKIANSSVAKAIVSCVGGWNKMNWGWRGGWFKAAVYPYCKNVNSPKEV
jgi:hypothetical protein